jgi:hypothetical protein
MWSWRRWKDWRFRAALPRFRFTVVGAPPDPLRRITLRTEAPVHLVVERR